MDSVITFIKGLVRTEAARLVAWSTMAASAAALFVADKMGVSLSPEFVSGVGVFAGILATELIRHLVFSEKAVEEIVDTAVEEAAEAP